MKRTLGPIISILIAAAIQGHLPTWLRIWGAQPDLILVVLIAYCLAADLSYCALLGFFAGIVDGSLVGLAFGSFVVTRTITGFLAGLTTTRVFSDNPFVPVLSAMWLTLACEMLFLFGNPRPDLAMVVRTVAGKCTFDGIIMLVLCLVMGNVQSRRKMRLVNARL